MSGMAATVDVRAGAVYLSAAVVERYFPGIDAVIVLIREGGLQVLPVHRMAAGGCLLKVRNAAGDRVATAPDVFHANGLGDWAAEGLGARWSARHGALVVDLPSMETAN